MPLYEEYDNSLDRNLIRQLIPSKGRIFLSGLTDSVIIFGALFFILFRFLSGDRDVPTYMIYVYFGAFLLAMIIFSFTFKRSVGMAICGILYIDGFEGMKIKSDKFWELQIENFLTGLKYSELFSLFYFYTTQLNQSKSMERAYVYYAKVGTYHRMVKDKTLPYHPSYRTKSVRYTGELNQTQDQRNE